MKNIVYIEERNVYSYPDKDYAYSPSIKYPEYPFEDISMNTNHIYDMVRSCLIGMCLDKKHFGQSCWNPMGDFIKKGDTVLIKPNLVLHVNHSGNDLDCVVTHPSVIRAITDYVLIALGNTGKVLIGDAPVQSCNFEELINGFGYSEISNFYSRHSIDVDIKDFRMISSKEGISGIRNISKIGDDYAYKIVNIGKESAFYEVGDSRLKNLRVTNYDPQEINKHHQGDIHEYLISQEVLCADVIINLPKPKTHRKAGITASLKNMIGINGNKDWLPHHTRTSREEGGDEYLNKSNVKKIITHLNEQIDLAVLNKNQFKSLSLKIVTAILYMFSKMFIKDNYYEGSWYGNDTIWRTICDINKILLFCDKEGFITNTIKRRHFILADMIISGELEGPLAPSPKKVGILASAYDAAAIDQVIAKIMGFDINKIPTIKNIHYGRNIFLPSEDFVIKSNNEKWNKMNFTDPEISKGLEFKPSKGWLGHIENNGKGRKY